MTEPSGNATMGQLKPRVAPEHLHEAAPALGWYTDQILFGENWENAELTKRDRSLVTCTTLITHSHFAQLVNHSKRAMANGIMAAELIEMVTHLAFYSGWPCAMSAIDTLRSVFSTEGVTAQIVATGTKDELPVCDSVLTHPEMLPQDLTGAPILADFTGRVILNDLWKRQTLAPRDRSLVTITTLIASGDLEQLPFHVRLGLSNGLQKEEMTGAVTHIAFYAGWPKAMSALPVLLAACAEASPMSTNE